MLVMDCATLVVLVGWDENMDLHTVHLVEGLLSVWAGCFAFLRITYPSIFRRWTRRRDPSPIWRLPSNFNSPSRGFLYRRGQVFMAGMRYTVDGDILLCYIETKWCP